MSFRKKIDMILEARKLQRLTKNKIEKIIGVDGTIYKAYDDDREPVDSEIVRNLIGKLGIRQQWWDKEWETGSKDIFITPVQKGTDIKGNSLGDDSIGMIRSLLELEKVGNYMFLPKSVLEGDYRLSLKSERDETIAALNKLIANLEGEAADKTSKIKELESRIATLTTPQKTK